MVPTYKQTRELKRRRCDLQHRLLNDGLAFSKGVLGDTRMRMPVLTYFLVVGFVLFGGMGLVSSQLEAKPLPVSPRSEFQRRSKPHQLTLQPIKLNRASTNVGIHATN